MNEIRKLTELFDREKLIFLLKRDALRLGEFRLASGRTSHYYVDGRKVTLSAGGARQVGLGVLEILSQYPEVRAVGGLTMGADPMVGATLALAEEYGRPEMTGFLVRKEIKSHGTGKLVEGPIESGMTVAVLDDVVTSGGSSLRAVEAMEALGCEVACVIAMLDRLEGGADTFEREGHQLHALCTIEDLGVTPLKPQKNWF